MTETIVCAIFGVWRKYSEDMKSRESWVVSLDREIAFKKEAPTEPGFSVSLCYKHRTPLESMIHRLFSTPAELCVYSEIVSFFGSVGASCFCLDFKSDFHVSLDGYFV